MIYAENITSCHSWDHNIMIVSIKNTPSIDLILESNWPKWRGGWYKHRIKNFQENSVGREGSLTVSSRSARSSVWCRWTTSWCPDFSTSGPVPHQVTEKHRGTPEGWMVSSSFEQYQHPVTPPAVLRWQLCHAKHQWRRGRGAHECGEEFCQENHLLLNVCKVKKLSADFLQSTKWTGATQREVMIEVEWGLHLQLHILAKCTEKENQC